MKKLFLALALFFLATVFAGSTMIESEDADIRIVDRLNKLNHIGYGIEGLRNLRFDPCMNLSKTKITSQVPNANVSILCLDDCLCGENRQLTIQEEGIAVRDAVTVNNAFACVNRKNEFLLVFGGNAEKNANACEEFVGGKNIRVAAGRTCSQPSIPGKDWGTYCTQKQAISWFTPILNILLLFVGGLMPAAFLYPLFLLGLFALNFVKKRNVQTAWAETRENKKILTLLGIASILLGAVLMWFLIGLLG